MRATFDVDPSWLLFCVHRECSCSICLKFTFIFLRSHTRPSANMQAPVVVMSTLPLIPVNRLYWLLLTRRIDTNAGDRQVGRRAQLSNITAAKTYAKFRTYITA